jgi:HK97 family phage portal protein
VPTMLRDLIQAHAGKALVTNPGFEDPGRPVGVVDLNLGRIPGRNPNTGMSGGLRLGQKGAQRHLSAYGGEQAMDWVMDCARYIADTVANADYHFETPQGAVAKRMPGDPVAPPDALNRLFEAPNPYMDYIEMMELMVIDLLLVGNAYWMKWRTNEKDQPLALYRLAPSYVEVTTKPWGIGSYIYQIPNADKLEVEPQEVIHFKLANPDAANPFYGLGLISGAGRAADLEIALTDTQGSYYENHAMPSVTVETARRVPRDVFKKIRAQLRSRAQGPKNAGELLVLEAGLKLNAIAPTALAAAYREMSMFSRDRTFAWFRMSPKLVGINDQAGGVDKLSEVQRQFDVKTARPLMNKIQTKLSKELTMAWNLNYAIDYEYQLDPEEQAKMAGQFAEIPGITIDEARKFAGLGPHPEKDIGEMTINLPGEDGGTGAPGDPTEKGIPDRNLPGEAGRPPNPGKTRAFPKKGQPMPKGAKVRRAKAKPAGKSVTEVLAALEVLEAKALQDPGTPAEDTLSERRVADVDETVSTFQAALHDAAFTLNHEIVGSLAEPEGKAFNAKDVRSKIKNSPGWKTFKNKATEAYEHALVKVMSAAAIHHSDLGLRPAGEIDYQKLIDELILRKESGVAAITQTFQDELMAKVSDLRAENATLAEVEAALLAAITHWQETKALDIAVTEATRGYNASTLAVAEDSGIGHVLVSDGTDHDEPCIEANGETWTIAKAQSNMLEHPRCRRAFVPLISS